MTNYPPEEGCTIFPLICFLTPFLHWTLILCSLRGWKWGTILLWFWFLGASRDFQGSRRFLRLGMRIRRPRLGSRGGRGTGIPAWHLNCVTWSQLLPSPTWSEMSSCPGTVGRITVVEAQCWVLSWVLVLPLHCWDWPQFSSSAFCPAPFLCQGRNCEVQRLRSSFRLCESWYWSWGQRPCSAPFQLWDPGVALLTHVSNEKEIKVCGALCKPWELSGHLWEAVWEAKPKPQGWCGSLWWQESHRASYGRIVETPISRKVNMRFRATGKGLSQTPVA